MKKVLLSMFVLFLLVSFSTISTSANELKTPSGIPIDELESFVNEYVDDYIGKATAGAAIVMTKGNDIVFSKGYGYADIEKKILMKPDTTILEWGSVSKLFVWTSVMQLVEQGKLNLEEDIRPLLPVEVVDKLAFDEPISMLNLMNHNAGFEDNIFDLAYSSPAGVEPLEKALIRTQPKQIYKPGEVTAYSNYATSLAAYIIEEITGSSFDDYLKKYILSPLNMTNTTPKMVTKENATLLSNKAKGYKLTGPSDFKEGMEFYLSLYPSGGMNGTAEDLAKFAMALTSGEALFKNQGTIEEMFSPTNWGNAHGFWEHRGQFKGLTHAGNTAVFSSSFQVVPAEDFGIVVLTNQAGEVDISYGLVHQILGENQHKAEFNLPDTTGLDGSYISARRMQTGMLNFYYYLIPLKVRSISSTEIEVSYANEKGIYEQVEPYLFKMKEGNNLIQSIGNLSFQVEDQQVKKISAMYSDYLPMPKLKSDLSLKITVIIFAISALYFVVMPLVFLINSIRKRRKKQSNSKAWIWNLLFHLSGTAIAINIATFILRMLSNVFRSYDDIVIHTWLNYVLVGIGIISFIFMTLKGKQDGWAKGSLFNAVIGTVMFFLLVAFLIYWRMFEFL